MSRVNAGVMDHENDGIEGQGDTSIDPADLTEVSGPFTEDGGSDCGVAETRIPAPRRRRRPQHLAIMFVTKVIIVP